ncbi:MULTISPECIES: AraC family transcriptional regulator [Prauserella salsuginis group]|uniref:Helix-turn-helix domain-containing protein n=1 Tax=Prauserella salsuginis TaxID=387889 RepID=A0ABW6FVW4_9PSEU|nr:MULTISPECIES: AraC family transcriptional regulator [Prauserella salsuginis group]MCR3720123.1 AraC-type DNA-binding protein [Prauserella flava]MCR3734168.1 AraC-type DNA-binding protein [Prauserella salsuginis]
MSAPSLARLAEHRGHAILDDTGDAGQTVDVCTGTLRPHSLTVKSAGSHLATRLVHVRLQDTSVNRLRYGTEVTVSSGDGALDDYLLTLPLSGHGTFRYGNEVATASPDRGVIIGPHREFAFDFGPTWDQLVIRLDRERVESAAAALTGDVGPVDFDLALAPGVATLDGLLESAVNLAGSEITDQRPRLMWQFEQLILETLLAAQPNNRTSRTGAGQGRPNSPRVHQAMEFMLDRLSEPLTVTAVAEACGTSVRTLQQTFRREVGSSPLQWLREQRLERAHALLTTGAPGLSVTDVAYRCGFFHLGEFGTAFRRRYGTTPSKLLATRR